MALGFNHLYSTALDRQYIFYFMVDSLQILRVISDGGTTNYEYPYLYCTDRLYEYSTVPVVNEYMKYSCRDHPSTPP